MKFHLFKVYGLGAAFDLATICEGEEPMEYTWTHLSFKIYLGPLMITGGFRTGPKRRIVRPFYVKNAEIVQHAEAEKNERITKLEAALAASNARVERMSIALQHAIATLETNSGNTKRTSLSPINCLHFLRAALTASKPSPDAKEAM